MVVSEVEFSSIPINIYEMQDGHTGIKTEEFKRNKTEYFDLSLNYLKESSGQGNFVIHAKSSTYFLSGLNPQEFLEILGFINFPSDCPHFGNRCFYRYAFRVKSEDYGIERAGYAYDEFDKLAKNIDEAYDLSAKVYQLIGINFNLFPWAERFNTQPKLLDLPIEVPGWVNDYKVPQHKEIEKAIEDNIDQDKYFKTIEYCLWGKGDQLEESVYLIFQDMGLKPEKTEKSATIDLLLEVPDTEMKFGIEITGTNESIRKGSKKINQAFTFQQYKPGNEKTIILANTYSSKPISEREKLVHFTDDAVKLLTPLSIVGMTTYSLYLIWKEVKYSDKEVVKIMRSIFEHPGGRFEYKQED